MPASTASRDRGGERRREEQDGQQGERVHHAGHRRLRARADVGRRAGDGAGGRQAADERRRDVGDALREELDVRVVPSPVIRSATTADISDSMAPSMATVSAGESSVRIEVGPESREVDVGQAGGDAAEPRADRLDRQAGQRPRPRCRPPARRCSRARAARAGSRRG